MARKKTSGKAAPAKAGKNGAGKKPKADKPSIEKLSDQERQRLLFQHKKKVKPLIAAVKDAQDDLRGAYEIAKNDGIPKKEIELAIQVETDDGIEKLKKQLEATKRIARWSNVHDQLDLFGKGEQLSRTERLFEDGRVAALNDQVRKAPDFLNQKDASTWMEGFDAGRTTLNTQRAEGFKPLSAVAENVLGSKVPPVGDAYPPDPVGDEPATHKEAA